jgi:maltokinase
MSAPPEAVASGNLSFLDPDALARFVVSQRWFGSKAREAVHFGVLDAVPLTADDSPLATTLVEARFPPGTHQLYQLPVALRPAAESWQAGVIEERDGWTVYDALADPFQARRLLGLMRREARAATEHAGVEFRWIGPGAPEPAEARPVDTEQSNTSVVFDDALILKAYRRTEPGVNPELELLRFLTERHFESVPQLLGWYEYAGRVMQATLGIVQEFLPGGRDGWELCLEHLARDPDGFLPHVRALGAVTGAMHSALGSETKDSHFTPEQPSTEALSLLTATVDEEIRSIFLSLPTDDPRVEPIAGRGEEVRERLRLLTDVGADGKVIRTHGDYHLGQTLLTPERGWVVVDFEGEPARSLPERRRKRSPLRDVAGMMRSFAYAASASDIMRGAPVAPEWEDRAREEFLGGYLETVDPSLLPPGRRAIERLLAVYELEKAVYELRYELNHRPDWVGIPVAGILRLLEGSPA